MLSDDHAAIGDVCTRRCTHPPFAGCLGEEESSTTASTRSLDVKWTEIPLEAKSEYYSDEEAVSWQLLLTLLNRIFKMLEASSSEFR